jgi:predicted MFS family arabinose efflux permease
MRKDGEIPQPILRHIFTRDFVLGFFALFTFAAAAHSLTPTLPLYLAKLGSNEREIGMLIGVYGVASLVSRVFIGGALVKFSERNIMTAGALLAALSYLSYVVFRPFWPFLIMRFFQGVAFACLDTAVLTVVINVTPQRYRGQAIGYLLLVSPLSMAISASLGVWLSNRYGFAVLFLACVGVALCSALVSRMIKGREADPTPKTTPGHNACLLDFNIIVPAMVTFFTCFSLTGLFAFIPLYAVQCGITNPGIFFSVVAVMLFVARILGGRILDACNKEKLIPASIFLLMSALVILSFSRTLPMFLLVAVIWGVGHAFVNPAAMAYALDYAKASGGTALGTYQMFMDLGTALGPVITGIIVPFTGYETMFLYLALVCLGNIAYFQFYVRKKGAMALGGLNGEADQVKTTEEGGTSWQSEAVGASLPMPGDVDTIVEISYTTKTFLSSTRVGCRMKHKKTRMS